MRQIWIRINNRKLNHKASSLKFWFCIFFFLGGRKIMQSFFFFNFFWQEHRVIIKPSSDNNMTPRQEKNYAIGGHTTAWSLTSIDVSIWLHFMMTSCNQRAIGKCKLSVTYTDLILSALDELASTLPVPFSHQLQVFSS